MPAISRWDLIWDSKGLISKRVPNSAYTNPSANYTENVCIVVMLDTCVWEMPGSNFNWLSGYPIVGFRGFPQSFQANFRPQL
jgi:hypothetical protein